MMKLKGFVKAEWRKEGRGPVIYLFCRKDDKKQTIKINNFLPYFYINSNESYYNLPYFIKIVDENVEKKTLFGNKKVKKILVNSPANVYEARKYFKHTYEADVLFVSRFLIDEIESIEKTTPLTLYFDIETTSDSGFPDNNNPIEKIISISFTTNMSNKIYLLLLQPPNKQIDSYADGSKKVKVFANEKEMLEFFFAIIKKIDPDVLTAWNIRFDINYLIARSKFLKINIEKYIHINHTNKWGDVDIWGINVFDLLSGFKQIYLAELSSYSLEYVAKMLLGEKEQKIKVLNIGKEWRKNPKFIAEYNIRDVEILKKIDEKVKIIDYWFTIMHLGFLPNLHQCQAFSFVLDNIILKKFKDKFVFPNKPHSEKKPIGGGYVKQPKRGLFDWVYVYDFSAMYPSIIKTFNLSKDTIVEKTEADYIINDVGWVSEGKKKGVLPQILDEMIRVRSEYKQKMKQYTPGTPEYELYFMKQFAMKFLVNSTYGVNAFPSFRLYDWRVGDTITYIGRTVAKYVAEKVEERLGYEVLYQDTDSVFVYVGEKNYGLVEKIENDLNKYTKEIVDRLGNGKVNNYMKIELDKIYDKILFCEKKRYIGRMVYKDGKEVQPQYKFVGVDLKRNNIPPIIKKGLNNFVKLLFEESEEKAKSFISTFLKEIETNNNIEDFAIPTKIEKVYKTNVPQQRAANFANKKWNLGFKPGSKFYSIWVKNMTTDIIGFDIPERVKEYVKNISRQKYKDMFLQKIQLLWGINIKNISEKKITDWM